MPRTARESAAAARGGAEPGGSRALRKQSPKNWYIIHTYSGFENKVQESLRTRADAFGFADKIGQILIPTEEVVELRNGKKVTSKRLVYPGYVLVEMEMNDELWHEVKNTPRVTGFVGGGNSPVPLSPDEVNSILYRQASSGGAAAAEDDVREERSGADRRRAVREFLGKVDEVNPERGTLRVMVTIFGRATPVELEFLQVEKGLTYGEERLLRRSSCKFRRARRRRRPRWVRRSVRRASISWISARRSMRRRPARTRKA